MPAGASAGRAEWLDDSTLYFLVWAFSMRFYEPDIVCQENVPSFPHDELREVVDYFGAMMC